MKHFSTKLPWIVGALAIVGFLVYGFWPRATEVDVAKVERGSLTFTVDDDGETRIREKYLVAAPVAGKLLRLQLHAGDRVERGKTELFQILPADPSLLDARARAESQARVQAADAAEEESVAALTSAREAAKLAQYQYERAVKLMKSNSISQAEYDEFEHHHRMAEAWLNSADFKSKVKQYEKEVARAALIRVTETNESGKDFAMKMVSPIDGQVLRIMHEDSSFVTTGTPILELGNPQDLELQIEVLSSDAVGIEPGAKVIIEHWGGEQPLHGTVRVVEPSAFLKISALGVEEKRVRVIADLVETWEERKTLGDGFRIEARIVVRSSETDSLKVAAGTLFRHQDDWHVYRIKNRRTFLTPVSIGLSNGLETEILQGLRETDLVVLHPSDQIRSGMLVSH